MGMINQKREIVEPESHSNWMGGKSFDIKNPLTRLRIAASSCFFGEPMYYHSDKSAKKKVSLLYNGASYLSDRDISNLRTNLDAVSPFQWRSMSPSELLEKAIDDSLAYDAEGTLQEAVRLRSEEHIRTTPQVILVRAAHHPKVRGTGLVRKYASRVIQRADEPAVGLAYHVAKYGKSAPVPNSLKKAWRDALSGFKEYHLAKYRMDDREVKTVDVVNLVHPKSEAVSKLSKGELKNSDQTWEAIISKEGSNKESWAKAIDVMGHMALLRNVRNLLDKGVPETLFLEKMVEGAATGKQLPFRYLSAYYAIKDKASGRVQDAIEKCLTVSLGNLPHFKGRTMSLCDNSGSAQTATTSTLGTMAVNKIANLTGILTGMRSDEGWLGIFGDKLERIPVRQSSSVFDQIEKADRAAEMIGQSTENGIWLFWDQAIRNKEHWDNVFIYSDMQAGHGGLYGHNPADYRNYTWSNGRHIDVSKLIKEYRRTVNKNVNVFLCQVAGYQDTIVPEFYNRTYILGGWGEGILRFAAEMSGLMNQVTQ